MSHVSHPSVHIEISFPVIECGSLSMLLKHQGPLTVYLQPLERIVRLPATTSLVRQAAIHITARREDDPQAPILYALCRAAEATGLNSCGSLTYPYQYFASPGELDQEVRRLSEELHVALISLLRACSLVRRLHTPGRIRLPDDWIWSTRTSLDELITLRDDHWWSSSED